MPTPRRSFDKDFKLQVVREIEAVTAAADTYQGTVTLDQVFSSDAKTTFQMRNLKPGLPVKVVYHQQPGIRYADKIIVLKS